MFVLPVLSKATVYDAHAATMKYLVAPHWLTASNYAKAQFTHAYILAEYPSSGPLLRAAAQIQSLRCALSLKQSSMS